MQRDRISKSRVRLSDSAFKRAFAALQPGDGIVVQGPVGHYLLDTSRPAVLVAGGIGITPLKGMAEYAADRQLSIPVRLVYSNRTVEEIVTGEELEALERSNPNFQALYTLTRAGSDSWKARTGALGMRSAPTCSPTPPRGLTAPYVPVRRSRLRGNGLSESGEFPRRGSRHPVRSLPGYGASA